MATLYAKIAGGNWSAAGTWSNVSPADVDSSGPPTAADDVIFSSSSGNVTIASDAVCRSADFTGGGVSNYTGTITVNTAININIGDASGGALAFSSGMTVTSTTGQWHFVSTSNNGGAGWPITLAGKTLNRLNFNGSGGKWTLQDACTVTADCLLTLGTLDTNGKTCSWGSFASTNSNVRTLTMGASAITITGTGTVWNTATSTNMTLTANTSTITCSGAAVTFNGGSLATYNDIILSGSGSPLITGASGFQCVNFTRTGTAVKTDGLSITLFPTVTGTFTATGNSVTNRIIVQSGTLGTARTITAAAVSLTNTDFMDIVGAGAATWTGTSLGDALGNSGITFDTPVTQTNTGATGNWSDVTKWTSRVPLPQDDVVINTGSGTITSDMPRIGMDINFTGFAGTVSFASTINSFFGSWTNGSGMTISGTQTLQPRGRGTHTITSAGKTFTQGIDGSASVGSTYTLQDALITSGSINFASTNGTFTTSNFNVTCTTFASAVASATINLGTSTISLTSTAASSIWSHTSGTLNASTSTIVITAATTNARTFAGNGRTYGTLTYTVDNSPGSLTITGANTFTAINVDSGKILTMPSATTNTVTTFNVNGAVHGYVYLPTVVGNQASAPDSAALSITGDITIDARIAMDDWTPATAQALVSKYGEVGSRSYILYCNTAGTLVLSTSADGTSVLLNTSSVATGLADGTVKWVRVSLDTNDEAGNRVCKFYLSDDGVAWTQLGTTITTVGVATIFDSTALLEMGDNTGGNLRFGGKFYNARIYNSYLQDTSGTPVFNPDFTTKTVGANTFVESSSNAATVTINGTLAQAGDGRVSLVSSSGGSAATLTSTNQQSVNYLSIQDSTVDASPKWYAGANSTDVSGNTNWLFVAAPSGGGGGSGGIQSKKALQNLQHL